MTKIDLRKWRKVTLILIIYGIPLCQIAGVLSRERVEVETFSYKFVWSVRGFRTLTPAVKIIFNINQYIGRYVSDKYIGYQVTKILVKPTKFLVVSANLLVNLITRTLVRHIYLPNYWLIWGTRNFSWIFPMKLWTLGLCVLGSQLGRSRYLSNCIYKQIFSGEINMIVFFCNDMIVW